MRLKKEHVYWTSSKNLNIGAIKTVFKHESKTEPQTRYKTSSIHAAAGLAFRLRSCGRVGSGVRRALTLFGMPSFRSTRITACCAAACCGAGLHRHQPALLGMRSAYGERRKEGSFGVSSRSSTSTQAQQTSTSFALPLLPSGGNLTHHISQLSSQHHPLHFLSFRLPILELNFYFQYLVFDGLATIITFLCSTTSFSSCRVAFDWFNFIEKSIENHKISKWMIDSKHCLKISLNDLRLIIK